MQQEPSEYLAQSRLRLVSYAPPHRWQFENPTSFHCFADLLIPTSLTLQLPITAFISHVLDADVCIRVHTSVRMAIAVQFLK